MLHRIVHIVVLVLLIQSCAQPTPQGKQRLKSFDEPLEVSKNSPLFHNQKDKLEQVKFKDERKNDPKVDALLKTVESAIQQKNLALLFTVMDQGVISSFGGGVVGHDGIVEVWGHDYQQLWNRLDKILAMGGSFSGDSSYSIPYEGNLAYEAQKVDEGMVPHGCGISTNENAMIYPNSKCRLKEGIQIGRTYAIVDLFSEYYQRDNEAIKINLLGTGIHGFIKNADFYISSGYSLFLEKNKQGTWKITSFAPWD